MNPIIAELARLSKTDCILKTSVIHDIVIIDVYKRSYKIENFLRLNFKTLIKSFPISSDSVEPVNIDNFAKFCVDCFNENPMEDEILNKLHAFIGLSGESGELLELIKKQVFHSQQGNDIKFKSEFGDVLFYYLVAIKLMKIDLGDIISYNITKLKDRYPNGRTKNYQIKKSENFAELEHKSQIKTDNGAN
jgi:NTP pyrophosphatase (non-canonical NTP hydrolase)